MTSLNKSTRGSGPTLLTHEGAPAAHVGKAAELRRSLMACMLWEDQFYEDGVTTAERIFKLAQEVNPAIVTELAIEAREQMKLRLAPLWVAVALAKSDKGRSHVAALLERIIRRPDEATEFLALYWKDGRLLPQRQVRYGLARAFQKFDAYQLAKYNRQEKIRLRDVLALSHAKPKDAEQDALWKQLLSDTLAPADTWENELSNNKDKKAGWTRLITENRLGAMATIFNLRNMEHAKVEPALIKQALQQIDTGWILPFRFIAAARAVPSYESELEQAMLRCMEGMPKLPGKTILVVDTSGSMHSGAISAKSDLTRVDAATALAIFVRGVTENPRIYATAGDDHREVHATMLIPARQGFALADAIWGMGTRSKLGGGGIFLTQCLDYIKQHEADADRIIVITDEQDCERSNPKKAPAFADAFGSRGNYLINVAAYRNGIGYKPKWTHIDGWSEAVVNYIREVERQSNQSAPASTQA